MEASSAKYEVRVAGPLGPAAITAFAELAPQVKPTVTVVSGHLDQPGLLDLLERIHRFGLEVLEVRRVSRPESGRRRIK